SYSVASHVIQRPTYDYEVDDTATIVLSGTTNQTSFSFATPNPASRLYAFHVTAREGANSTSASVSINQASGVLLGVSFDKSSYVPGELIHGHLFLLLLVAVLGLWRRTGGGSLFGPRAARPPPGPGPVQAPASAPMSIACRRCGKPVEITTSKRPIEVMCPSCGETQVVT